MLVVMIVAAIWAGLVAVALALCAAAGRADELTQRGVGRRGVRGPRDRRREARPGSPERRSRHRAWLEPAALN